MHSFPYMYEYLSIQITPFDISFKTNLVLINSMSFNFLGRSSLLFDFCGRVFSGEISMTSSFYFGLVCFGFFVVVVKKFQSTHSCLAFNVSERKSDDIIITALLVITCFFSWYFHNSIHPALKISIYLFIYLLERDRVRDSICYLLPKHSRMLGLGQVESESW